MKKLIVLLFISNIGFAQLSPAISNVYFEASLTDGSNRGVTSDALFDSNASTLANIGLKANTSSPILTGDPKTPTPAFGDNDTSIVNSAFVTTAISVFNNVVLQPNPTGAATHKIIQAVGTNDNWAIYGEATVEDVGKLVFEVGDNGFVGAEMFEFRYNASASGVSKTPFSIDYNDVTANANFRADSLASNTIIEVHSYTVATLPVPTGTAYATVIDALAPSYMVAVVGGGTVVCPVFYNGTIWVSH